MGAIYPTGRMAWNNVFYTDELLLLISAWVIYHNNIDDVNIGVCKLIQRLEKQRYRQIFLYKMAKIGDDYSAKKCVIQILSTQILGLMSNREGQLLAWYMADASMTIQSPQKQ